jgi:hypothetical protein
MRTRGDASGDIMNALALFVFFAALTLVPASPALAQQTAVREITPTVRMTKYEGWTGYKDWLPLKVEGVLRMIQLNRRGN